MFGAARQPCSCGGERCSHHQRPWADDVAQLLEAGIDGSHVHLKNVRNFSGAAKPTTPRSGRTRTYDLDRLRSADRYFPTGWGRTLRTHWCRSASTVASG